MSSNQKEICKTLQIILWVWFGTITSFVSVNVVNIARLETEKKMTNERIGILELQYINLKHNLEKK